MADNSKDHAAQLINYLLKNDSFSQWMGIKVMEADDGYCKLSCRITDHMLNGYGVTHGGILFSLADTALAFAAASSGRVSLVVDHSISFTNSSKQSELITAEASIEHQSHKLSVGTVKISDKTGRTLCVTKGTIYKKTESIDISNQQ